MILLLMVCGIARGQGRIFELRPADRTVLPANDALLTDSLKNKPYRNGADPKVFAVADWKREDQFFTWTLRVPQKGSYKAAVLCKVADVPKDTTLTLVLSAADHTVSSRVGAGHWNRVPFAGLLQLPEGTVKVRLKMAGVPAGVKPDLSIYSVELVRPAVQRQMEVLADSLRSRPAWLSQVRYGLFFHWNSKSMPQSGKPKTYREAVADFNVDKFAAMVHETGAGFIVLTTSWAAFYFPAPLHAIDEILPGRTATRDLVSDLSDALARYGIRLLLYYNFHSDINGEWWKRQAFSPEHPQTAFRNMIRIFREISRRYGEKIAGLWVDDGMALYPYDAPFRDMTLAAKSGNRQIIIGYNPWIYPSMTVFQDFYTGEAGINPEAAGVNNPALPPGGSGYFTAGPQQGLKATFCGQLEAGDWTHTRENSDIPPPVLSAAELIRIVREAISRKNIPIMNVSVYQDGRVSPATLELLKKLKQATVNYEK